MFKTMIGITTALMLLTGSITAHAATNPVVPVKKGTGVWIYGKSVRYVNEIKTFNKMVNNPEKKIRYLFCYAGSVEAGKLVVFDTTIGAFYKKYIPDAEIYINVDGYPSIDGLNKEQIAVLGKEIAQFVDMDKNVAGIHLNIEPYESTQLLLIEEYKKHTKKTVNISISVESKQEEKLFTLTNFVVLMNYDLNLDLGKYTSISKEATRNLLANAVKYNGQVMIGLPAIATHHEYQYKAPKTEIKQRISSGNTMVDYLKVGIEGCKEAKLSLGDKNFVGVSIWAFLLEEEPVGSYPKTGKNWFYPVSVGLAEWNQLMEK